MNKFKVLLGVSALLVNSVASASLISHNGYTLDTDTDIVTGGGLEWLQWDQTLGNSVQWLLDGNAETIAGGGWRLADNTDMSTLFNSFSFGVTFDADETTSQAMFTPYTSSDTTDPHHYFIELFGYTIYDENIGLEDRYEARAFFGGDSNQNDLYNFAAVQGDYISTLSPEGKAVASMHDDWHQVANISYGAGLALVRDHSVPEPSILALFAAGLFGLGFARHHKLRQS